MDANYYLFLITFLLFPIAAIVVYQFAQFDKVPKLVKVIIAFLLAYDILYLLGYSLKGDFADYLVFSVEYLILCIALTFKSKRAYAKVLRIVSRTFIYVGIVAGLIGIYLFPAIAQDYQYDSIYHFVSKDKKYNTRRYSFGFATLESARYTFETFRQYSYLPIEKKIDKTDLFDNKTNLNIDEDKLQINLQTIGDKQKLVFTDKEGNVFSKLLD